MGNMETVEGSSSPEMSDGSNASSHAISRRIRRFLSGSLISTCFIHHCIQAAKSSQRYSLAGESPEDEVISLTSALLTSEKIRVRVLRDKVRDGADILRQINSPELFRAVEYECCILDDTEIARKAEEALPCMQRSLVAETRELVGWLVRDVPRDMREGVRDRLFTLIINVPGLSRDVLVRKHIRQVCELTIDVLIRILRRYESQCVEDSFLSPSSMNPQRSSQGNVSFSMSESPPAS